MSLSPLSVSRKGLKHETTKLTKQINKAAAQRAKRLTPKQERFAREMANNAPSQTAAALAAGYSPNGADVTASRTLDNARVKERLAELQARNDKRQEMTRDASQARMLQLAKTALELGQVAAAVRAEELAGRMAGLYVERNETVQMNLELERLSTGDLQKLMSSVAQRLLTLANGTSEQDGNATSHQTALEDLGDALPLAAPVIPAKS